jgi:hypothetical protein
MLRSYPLGAVSYQSPWPTGEKLEPEEAFTAGLDAIEAQLLPGPCRPTIGR